jgi:adenosylhomocysteinase
MSEIRNISLAASGEQKIEWVTRHMPIMAGIEAEFEKRKPFSGLKIALSVHMEAKTARLCRALKAGGAEMHVTGCNPLSTQDDVAAALALGGIDVHAWHNATEEEYTSHLCHVLEIRPDIIIDDGADLTHLMHTKFTNLIYNVIGGCEETTTGIMRVSAMAASGVLKYPIIAVNNAKCKYMFDNRYGTGQSVWDSINRTTNLIVAGKRVVIAGYGWCGHGIALRAQGLGAKVIICEVNPIHALEAMMDGFEVMPMDNAAPIGDVFVTSTSCLDVITQRHFEEMKDGAIMCNAGHFNVELDMDWLEKNAVEKKRQRENIMGYTLQNGRTISVIAEGRLVNLASGDGHPAEIMDMSFALQSLSVEYLVKNGSLLPNALVPVPEEIDDAVARKKLEMSGIRIDSLTAEQRAYLSSWEL